MKWLNATLRWLQERAECVASRISELGYVGMVGFGIIIVLRGFGLMSLPTVMFYGALTAWQGHDLAGLRTSIGIYLPFVALATVASFLQKAWRELPAGIDEIIHPPVVATVLAVAPTLAHEVGLQHFFPDPAHATLGQKLADFVLMAQALYLSLAFVLAGRNERPADVLVAHLARTSLLVGHVIGSILFAAFDLVASVVASPIGAFEEMRSPVTRFCRYRIPLNAAFRTSRDREEWIDRVGPRLSSVTKFVATLHRDHGFALWTVDSTKPEQRLLWDWTQKFVGIVKRYQERAHVDLYAERQTPEGAIVVAIDCEVFDAIWSELRELGREHPAGENATV